MLLLKKPGAMQLQFSCIKRINNLYFVINELFCNSLITLLCIAKEVLLKQTALNHRYYNTWIGNSFCGHNMHCSCDVAHLKQSLLSVLGKNNYFGCWKLAQESENWWVIDMVSYIITCCTHQSSFCTKILHFCVQERCAIFSSSLFHCR